jgi:hypothetical protein
MDALLRLIKAHERIGSRGGHTRRTAIELDEYRAFNIAHANAIKTLRIVDRGFSYIYVFKVTFHKRFRGSKYQSFRALLLTEKWISLNGNL